MEKPHPTYGYMKVTEHKQIAQQWEKYKGFTIRPLPSTQAFYQSVVERYSVTGDPVMVHGGTPEVRNAILDAGERKTTLVDRSLTMVHAMGLLVADGKPLQPTETAVEGQWLKLPVADNSQQVVLGDDAVNMVSWPEFPQFMDEAHRVLKDGGVYGCHLLVQPMDAFRGQPIEEVVAEYANKRIPSLEDYASRVNFAFYDEDTYKMGWQQSIKGLREALGDKRIKNDHGFIQRFAECGSVFACPPQKDFEKLVAPKFKVLDVFYPTEHDYSAFEPLYVLQKK